MIKIFSKIKTFFTNKYTLYTIFWGCNILGSLGFLSVILPWSFRQEFLPWNVAIMLYILLLVPVSAVWFGLFTRAKKEPQKLIVFLFAVEIPIVFLALVRLLFIRQMTEILWLFFLSLFVAIVGFIVFFTRKKIKTLTERVFIFLSQEIALIIGSYLLLLTVFFLPVIIALIVRGILEIDISNIWLVLMQTKGLFFFSLLFSFLLSCVTISLLIITPIATFLIYWRSFNSNKKELVSEYKYTGYLQYAFGFLYILVGILFAVQWHSDSYNTLMTNYFEATNFEEQQKYAAKLIDHDKSLQRILRNEYLAPYRFLTDKRRNELARGYTQELNVPESMASGIQSFFNVVALPFVYQSYFATDTKQAKEQYAKLFDAPLQEGERDELVKAMKATNTKDRLKAGILDEESKNVYLVSRTVKSTTENNGMFVKVSIEEEYENVSDDMQEVYYEFSLPQEAIITGLWLGPELEYTGVIAPKGAAREQQVTRRVAPALLEQIGPRQYRLRVFPIKPVSESNQRVKFEYIAFASPEGIPLPIISTKRNIYEDKKSLVQFFANGQKQDIFTISANHCNDKTFNVETSIGTLSYLPHHLNPMLNSYNCTTLKFVTFPSIKDKKIAFLFDASYSSKQRDWSEYLKEKLPINTLAQNNDLDAYFFTTQLSQPVRLTPERLRTELSVIHFGQTARLKALQLLPQQYDVILMFTDGSDSDVGFDKDFSYPDNTPIYIIHDNNSLPQYHDDLTLTVLRSGGGVFTEAKEVLELMTLKQNSQTLDGELLAIDKYGAWLLNEVANPIELSGNTDDLFAHKQAINKMLQHSKNELEKIHQIALSQGIVSPYSSYIVSKKKNKFEADYDSEPSMKLRGIPEPEEWALLITAVFLLAYLYRQELMRLIFQK